MATLKEIAREAGVSVMTVSNVINRNYDKVSAKTAERVEKSCASTTTCRIFRRAASAESTPISLRFWCRRAACRSAFWRIPYRQKMIGAMEFYFRQRGYYVMLRAYKTAEEIISLFHNWSVDGGVFFTRPFRTAIWRGYWTRACPAL